MAVGKEYLLVGRMFVVVIVALDGRSVGGTADKRLLLLGRCSEDHSEGMLGHSVVAC